MPEPNSEDEIQARIDGVIGFRFNRMREMWECDMCGVSINKKAYIKPCDKTKHLHSQKHIDRSRDYFDRYCQSEDMKIFDF
ncbi:MAG TPA: hypothetical protein VKR58_14385 [Aquella sp.]|nr:hypothetical protein [Aquella sp.]